jgi:hypothetical protein
MDLYVDTNASEKHPISALNMEAVCSSETLVAIYKCTRITNQKTNIDVYQLFNQVTV